MNQLQTQKELWKVVDNWPDYEISSGGKVRRSGRLLRPQISGSGYLFVTLCGLGKKKMSQVHQLVALAFCGYGREVNHMDGDKHNNSAANLEWVTRSENQRHAADIGRKPSGEQSHLCTKLNAEKVRQIRALLQRGVSQSQIGQQFNISQSHVGKIKRNLKWRQLK